MDTIRAFLWKSGHFCRFQKGQGRSSLSPLVVRLWMWLNMHQYPWICPNKYPWKCLRKLFSLCQCSEYAWTSYMFERLLKKPRVPNKPRFWIWHGCLRKGDVDFPICLIMALYPSIMPENAAMCLNVPQYAWKWLNIAKYHWIYQKMPELTVLTILELSICHDMVIKLYYCN